MRYEDSHGYVELIEYQQGILNIPDNSVDLIMTDIPYQQLEAKWDVVFPLNEMWVEFNRVLKTPGNIVMFNNVKIGAEILYNFFKVSGHERVDGSQKLIRDFQYYELIWIKTRKVGFANAGYDNPIQPLREHENIYVFYDGGKSNVYNPQYGMGKPYKGKSVTKTKTYTMKGEAKIIQSDGRRNPTTILSDFPLDKINYSHPTQKPESLCDYLIKTYSNPSGLVLDICAGSGPTLVSAKKNDRGFIGFEIEPEYFGFCVERLRNVEVSLDYMFGGN